ncbi:MAG: heme ABC exporter ATP-binding protein CcmA [Anaerolineales bacterium]
MIEAHGLVKTYAGRLALRGVDVRAAAGEIVAIAGPNGAGKTTLLRILASLARPSAGSVRIAGMELPGQGPAVRRRIGFLSHSPLVYPDLSGEENLSFYGRLYGIPNMRERVVLGLRAAGLEDVGRDPVRSYSRGMQQRLGLTRALLHAPSVLLLDEPYANLDTEGRESLDRTLRIFAEEGGCVLMTSHDLDRLEGVADRVEGMALGRMERPARIGLKVRHG